MKYELRTKSIDKMEYIYRYIKKKTPTGDHHINRSIIVHVISYYLSSWFMSMPPMVSNRRLHVINYQLNKLIFFCLSNCDNIKTDCRYLISLNYNMTNKRKLIIIIQDLCKLIIMCIRYHIFNFIK